ARRRVQIGPRGTADQRDGAIEVVPRSPVGDLHLDEPHRERGHAGSVGASTPWAINDSAACRITSKQMPARSAMSSRLWVRSERLSTQSRASSNPGSWPPPTAV